jgi:hypothetical protein
MQLPTPRPAVLSALVRRSLDLEYGHPCIPKMGCAMWYFRAICLRKRRNGMRDFGVENVVSSAYV